METQKSAKLYRSVRITGLARGRRGKHHDLMEGIVRELKVLKEGLALEIPLANVGGVELANLRSAVHRAAITDNLQIETQADEKNLYVWLNQGSQPTNGHEKKST